MSHSLGGWVDRPESIQCCPNSPGPVKGSERIVRLLHTRIVEPDFDPLKRSEFFPPKNGFSNICGDADGCSVIRASDLTDEEINQKSEVQASRREGRSAQGALVTVANDLRNIRMIEFEEEQLVFIYDDPLDNEIRHCVVRGSEKLNRPDQDKLRYLIRECFNKYEKIMPKI